MAQQDTRRISRGAAVSGRETDAGLREFMLGVYNNMILGLAITGLVAMGTSFLASANPALAAALYQGPLSYVIMFAPLAFILFISFRIESLSPNNSPVLAGSGGFSLSKA